MNTASLRGLLEPDARKAGTSGSEGALGAAMRLGLPGVRHEVARSERARRSEARPMPDA